MGRFPRIRAVMRIAMLAGLFWGILTGTVHLVSLVIEQGGFWSLEGMWGYFSNEFVRGVLRGFLGGATCATILAVLPARAVVRLTLGWSALIGAWGGVVVYLVSRVFVNVLSFPIPLLDARILTFAAFGGITAFATVAVAKRGELPRGKEPATPLLP